MPTVSLTMEEQPLRSNCDLTPSIEPTVPTSTSGSQLRSGMCYLPLMCAQIYHRHEARCQGGAGAGVGLSAGDCGAESAEAVSGAPPVCADRMPCAVAVLVTRTPVVHLFLGRVCGVLTASRPRSCSCFLLRELWSWRLWAKATDLRLRRRLD